MNNKEKNMNMVDETRNKIIEMDVTQAPHIFFHPGYISMEESLKRYENSGNKELAEYVQKEILKFAESYKGKYLNPDNVEVGEGVTIQLFSDAHAGTVIRKTVKSVTVRRDKATLKDSFKPEFHAGGFAAHCSNQSQQEYNYERDPEGETITFRWSDKFQAYQSKGRFLKKGRKEFYDYNF
jgi:hypothetical protein